MSKLSRFGHDLYDGTISIDFVGRKLLWYSISAVIVLVSVAGLLLPKLNMGIEFEGGVEYRVAMGQGNATPGAVTDIREAVAGAGVDAAKAPIVNTSGSDNIRIQTEPLTTDEADKVSEIIQKTAGVRADDISQDVIGPSWGRAVANRALLGLGVFVGLVILMIWGYFREWKMSVAAIVALAHDLVITVGVYAWSRFEVTPATVTGFLTILGFSLYDTVVVFDKVRENVASGKRMHRTYAESANLAVNQTLVRSINTSVVALLPVGALLYVGAVYLGSGALKDLALALFVGMAAGAYSSIFIATPLLVQLKEREPGVRAGDARARKHRSRREVDRYASVPAYSDDMPVYDEPAASRGRAVADDDLHDVDDEPRNGGRPVTGAAPGRFSAGERSTDKRSIPLGDTSAARRPQPTRKPRSQRGKK
ncbi:protein translocase subunit SecF [Nocardioides marmoribigeumensis]|jgi:preprotein translocase subunit SecF|uniref:Protein-export membrane protein SecF n=1 Tax=Nocardioides marmoribigeumensis TaxID=433649 RepID=A0ABU2BQW0_9ACTN|nr:protein translocase subunit SecF [Nocardioides marmoribigeumensis]MDR7361028.1 preprotein translocase subunit SecF [Nocardioides marmoribigeumensis]